MRMEKAMLRAIAAPNRLGPYRAWAMMRASYLYSRAHGLTIIESLEGALPLIRRLWSR